MRALSDTFEESNEIVGTAGPLGTQCAGSVGPKLATDSCLCGLGTIGSQKSYG